MWIAAASKLQRAWRVHTLRRGLQRAPALRRAMLHAVTRLQALLRGRPARLAFLTQRAAAVKLQASMGKPVSDMHRHSVGLKDKTPIMWCTCPFNFAWYVALMLVRHGCRPASEAGEIADG